MGDAPKKKRAAKVDEPPLGFGREIELDVHGALDRWLRGAVLVLGIALAFGFGGAAMARTDARGHLVQICAAGLGVISLWMFAVLARNRGRTDLVARFDHRRIDIPRITLFGPPRFTCAYDELAAVTLMQNRSGMWIELITKLGLKAIVPLEWVKPLDSIFELYWRLELRTAVARHFHGRAPRAAIVGAEAMVVLGRPDHPIAGVVISRSKSKHPIVVAPVDSVREFFTRVSEWPEDAVLSVPSDARERLLTELADPSRLL